MDDTDDESASEENRRRERRDRSIWTDVENMLNYNPFMPLANATGQPAMSVPTHWTEEGIPVGTHFFGRLGEDELLFQLAHQIEKEQPWFHKYKEIKL